jgi:hypothetical protein
MSSYTIGPLSINAVKLIEGSGCTIKFNELNTVEHCYDLVRDESNNCTIVYQSVIGLDYCEVMCVAFDAWSRFRTDAVMATTETTRGGGPRPAQSYEPSSCLKIGWKEL